MKVSARHCGWTLAAVIFLGSLTAGCGSLSGKDAGKDPAKAPEYQHMRGMYQGMEKSGGGNIPQRPGMPMPGGGAGMRPAAGTPGMPGSAPGR